MPEDKKETSPSPKGPVKPGGDVNMESRLLLAFILFGAVLFFTQWFYNPVAPDKPAVKQSQPASPAQAAKPSEPAAMPTGEPAQQIAAPAEQTYIVDTEVYKVTFSNRGAVVRSWILKKYKDSAGQPLDLVNHAAVDKAGYPLSLAFKEQKPSKDLNWSLFVGKQTADGLGLDFEFSNGRTTGRKSFRFQRNSYLADVSSEVLEGTAILPHFLSWRGGFGDPQVHNSPSTQQSLYFDTAARKLVIKDHKAAQDGIITDQGNYSFAGLQDAFFAAVFLPKQKEPIQIQTWSEQLPMASNKDQQEAHVGAAVGGSGQNQFALFVGPKDLDLLRRVDPALEEVVDFGYFGFLARPLFLALNYVNDHFVQNYGWSILLVTVLINIALMPLKFTSMKSMKKMQALQPQVAAIQEKYKHLSMRDPKKQEGNQEVMALYKRNNVNPMGGCMPMLLQIPFFIAFYTVLTVAIEMRGARWLWVNDLSQPESLPIHILPILMVVTQFFLQKMTPNTTMDPAQQRVMLLMPLMFAFFFYNSPSGLVLYWLTGNLVGILQQWLVNRMASTPAVEVIPPAPKKKKEFRN